MLSIPRRRPVVWALCAVLSAAAWALLLSGLMTGRLTGHEVTGVGLMFAGGWNLSLMPVHACRWAARRDRRAAPTGAAVPEGTAPEGTSPGDAVSEDAVPGAAQNAEA